jgi:ubiquinone/menaquinone biosynthesis C-methylase UbiE/catechol 2,3-dioxygenase-like lactoylglutathione lyase family enzyme
MFEETQLIEGLDHIQVTAPRAEEARAKAFYGEVLGLREIPKPAVLAERGGAWYAVGDKQLHLGLEDAFLPQRKGHPAFVVADLAAMRARLEAAGAPITVDVPLPGCERFEAQDPFGNRLEFLCHLAGTAVEAAARHAGDEIKAKVREMFGRTATAYVTSPGHAHGDDLGRLIELAAAQPTDRALDISTGGGHTALALAPHVSTVVASDLTPEMLAAARAFIASRGVTNVEFVVADAERLPFLGDTFDLVTVRIAPHHYADVRAAVREMARVLMPGGRLVLIDNVAPEDPTLDALENRWEKLRDPSHVRNYTVAEWRGFLGESGLRITSLETGRKAYAFLPWAERMRLPEEARVALEAEILSAPQGARSHFGVVERDGRLEAFAADYVILAAVK